MEVETGPSMIYGNVKCVTSTYSWGHKDSRKTNFFSQLLVALKYGSYFSYLMTIVIYRNILVLLISLTIKRVTENHL